MFTSSRLEIGFQSVPAVMTSLILALAVCVTGVSSCAASRADRVVSMRVMQTKLRQCADQPPCPAQAIRLAGLRDIHGIVVDTVNRDLILLGSTKSGGPELYTDDLIVAMRHAWGKYDSVVHNTRYTTSPGCSIDPDPEIIRKLNDLFESSSNAGQDWDRLWKEWEKLCAYPQDVVTFGVPPSSHYSQVTVDADYLLKDLSNGSVDVDIQGFTSHLDMLFQAITKAVRDNTQPPSFNPMNRYWFAAGESRCHESNQGFYITRCQVNLMTETQYVSSLQQGVATGQVDSLAAEFADSFVAHYDELESRFPVYRELRNSYRLTLLALLAREKSLDHKSGLDLSYLLNEYPVSELPYETTLPGRCNTQEVDVPIGERSTVSLLLLSYGGVTMDFKEDEIAREPATPTFRSEVMRILVARPSPETWYWDVSPLRIR